MAKDINLYALGVPESEQNDVPDVNFMPLEFNSSAENLWKQAVSTVKTTDPKTAWARAVRKYLDLCSKADLFPFKYQQTKNDKVYEALVKARREVVKFMDRHELYAAFKPRSVTRQVSLLNHGFVIKAEARADVLDKDPKLIHVFGVFDNMGLRKSTEAHPSVWERSLDHNVRFFVANEGARMSQRWSFGYEIAIPMFPTVSGTHTPSNSELEHFILDVVYKPLVKAIRPLGTMHKLL